MLVDTWILVSLNGTCFMQLMGGEQKRAMGDEQKRAPRNRTPLERGTIEASVNNSFSTRSGKKLQLETLDLYKTAGKVGAYSFLFVGKRL